MHELQEAIIYAQGLLNTLHESPLPIEPKEILRVDEHPGYIEVVKRFDGGEDVYLYHVETEPDMDGGERPHWRLIGRVASDEV